MGSSDSDAAARAHAALHRGFERYLDARQSHAPADLDVRARVLGLREARVAFGFTRRNLQRSYPANLPLLFPNNASFDEPGWRDAAAFFGLGTIWPEAALSHPGLSALFRGGPPPGPVFLMEQAFIASAGSWSLSFRGARADYACLGYLYDDIAHYFMAERPNRLIEWLNGPAELSDAEAARARALMRAMTAEGISKYNAQSFARPTQLVGERPRVLVVDQTVADASVTYGLLDRGAFETMLLDAIDDHPGAEILVKTHPDTAWEAGERSGYFTGARDYDRVRFLTEPVNPYVLFDLVDAVYVGSSGMGLEALIAGKPVVTYGAPFYAGWGLTEDRLGRRRAGGVPHRRRPRRLEALFHAAYVQFPIYHRPQRPAPCALEEVFDFIIGHRPERPSLTLSAGVLDAPERPLGDAPAAEATQSAQAMAVDAPLVSVVIPVHGVERYVAACLRSVLGQSLGALEAVVVDDASPDRSAEIVAQIAEDDARVRLIRLEENVGQGFARNVGIQAARGRYVWLLDADDWLENPYALGDLAQAAERTGADMVRGRKAFEQVETARGKALRREADPMEAGFEGPERVTRLAAEPELLMRNRHCWTFLYRSAFLRDQDIRFLTGNWEERPFLVKALLRAEAIALTPVAAVGYRRRPGSTTRRAKSLRDVENLTKTVEAVIGLFRGAGAAAPGSALRPALAFAVSQSLGHILRGFAAETLSSSKNTAAAEALWRRLAAAFRDSGIGADALTDAPLGADPDLFRAGAYGLALEALKAERVALAMSAARGQTVASTALYTDFLDRDAPAELVSALNRYARNTRSAAPKGRRETGVRSTGAGRAPRLLLHLGATKTGSTAIQHFLDANRPALLRRGVWVPEFGLFAQAERPWKTAGHARFLHEATGGRRVLRDRLWAGLAALRSLGAEIDTVVVSSEAFFLSEHPEQVVGHFEGFVVEALLYLRRQDLWAEAQYAEYVAGGAVGRVSASIETWLADPRVRRLLDYEGVVGEWRAALGPGGGDRLIVRAYERAQLADGDGISDFIAAARLPAADLPRPAQEQANATRVDAAEVAAFRRFNALPFADSPHYLSFMAAAERALAARRATPRRDPLLSAAARAEILRASEPGNAAVARSVGRPDGRLFLDASAPQADAAAAPLSAAELDGVFAAYFAHAGPGGAVPAATASAAPAARAGARATGPLVHYGLFGWRRALKPAVRPFVRKYGSAADLQRFEADPALFFQSLTAPKHRLAARLLYPAWPIYGPFGVLRLSAPLVGMLVGAVSGGGARSAFRADPAAFFRRQTDWRLRLIGRALYPIGELPGASAGR